MTSLSRRKYDKDEIIHKASITIDSVHNQIHHGHNFAVVVKDTDVDVAGPKYVLVTTPNTTKRIHLHWEVYGSAAFTADFYENPTLDGAGTPVTAYNKDRNNAFVTTATIKQDITTSADGTIIESNRGGGSGLPAAKVSGDIGSRTEYILKQNEDYIIKVTVDGDNTQVIVVLDFYEEDA